MLKNAKGSFDDDPIAYINCQLRYHLGISKDELTTMPDEEWARNYAILTDIRKEEAKQRPF